MQGIHGSSFHKRLAQLPFNAAVSWRSQQQTLVLPSTTPSVSARSRCAGGEGRWLSSVCRAPSLWLRFWLHDRKSRHRESYSSFEHRTLHVIPASPHQGWKICRTPGTFQSTRLLLPATMTTMSATTDEGGSRQLRRRKEALHSVSATQVVVSVMASNSKHQNNSRKKSAKAAAGSSPIDDDVKPTSKSKEEPSSTDLEARLWNLDKTDQLTSLTVVELRGLMKHIGKPTAGRKEELIAEVKKWLTQRQAAANHQSVLDCARPTRESSSDAESLEGTLLKAESNKSRQTEAISRMTDAYAGANLQETLVEKKPLRQDPQTMAEDDDSLHNGNSIPARKLPQGSTRRQKKPEKESDDEDFRPATVQVEERKPRSSRRGTKVEKQVEESVEEEVTVTTTKTGQKRKVQVSKRSQSKKGKVTEVVEVEPHTGPPWTMLVHKKPQPDWIVYNPDTMRPDPPPSGTKTMKLMSWNVNGLRALMKDKDKKAAEGLLLVNLANEEDFDVLCLQETKLQEKDVEQISKALLSDYSDRMWSCSTSKLGYSGTAVFSRVKPVSVKSGLGIPDHDSEGRLITVEFDTFFLLTSYVPNSGEKLARLSYRTEEWDTALSQYVKELEKQKPVILTGDLNCANEEIDIYNPDGNRKSAGFTNEERASFKDSFLNQGMVDTFREQHPNAVAYTYWGYRSGARPKNQGWRLDYFLVSEALKEQIHDSYVRPDVLGSDHCPVGIILKL